MATVPSETIPPAHVATALGFIMGIGEIVGGFGGPGLAGLAADLLGPSTPFWMVAAGSTIASGLALLLGCQSEPDASNLEVIRAARGSSIASSGQEKTQIIHAATRSRVLGPNTAITNMTITMAVVIVANTPETPELRSTNATMNPENIAPTRLAE